MQWRASTKCPHPVDKARPRGKMSHRRRASRYRGGRSLAAVALALASVMAVVVVAVAVLRSPMHSVAGPQTSRYVPHACSSSGCAIVSVSRTLQPIAVFYGASCEGVYGSWFFNAVEGGTNADLHPSYSLNWSFTPGSVIAKPNGSIDVAPTSGTQVALTLRNGMLSLAGTRKPNVRISAAGTLVVEVTGPTTAPALKFTETGLLKAESALGFMSPFTVQGEPLTVPVRTVKTMVGC